jgi:glycerophosphoryl diester phosphodiesterase
MEEEETFEQIILRTGGFPVNAVHRGGGGDFGPENTMYAFRKCLQYGARLLEIDLRLSKDHQLCIMHDSSVERTTNGHGPLHRHTLAELQALDAAQNYPLLRGRGIGVPSFAEFLAEFAPVPDLLFFLDFKDEEAVRVALKQLEAYPELKNRFMLGSVFQSCNRYLRKVRQSEAVPVCSDIRQTFRILGAYYTWLLPHYRFQQEVAGFILLDRTQRFWHWDLVAKVHASGVRVLLCGDELSRPEVLRECVAHGVDYIMTDRPDLLQQILLEEGGKQGTVHK